jgi:phosphoribosylamine--glycine ligase
MNIMIVGGGAREHALAWKLRQSPLTGRVFIAPGNAGITKLAEALPIAIDDIEGLLMAARQHDIDLTVVGPEGPLAAGIVDSFQELGLAIFGPTKGATQIESSKSFAKDLMQRYSIPCARGEAFDSPSKARAFIDRMELPVVVKANGLAAGKGVVVATTREEAVKAVTDFMEFKVLGQAGELIIVEEYLEGQEVSVFCFSDGEHLSPLVAACDYKRAYDGDKGPNTGGMGSYSPPRFWDHNLDREIRKAVMEPTVAALAREGYPYKGILYGGLMLTRNGPQVLEFNSRLGDPEAQVILPRLHGDLAEITLAVASGNLTGSSIEWADSDLSCVGVVMVSGGYPGDYRRGVPISGLDSVQQNALVYHGGTKLIESPQTNESTIVTDGGRVLTVVGLGTSLQDAQARAYQTVHQIHFEDCFYRQDIAM